MKNNNIEEINKLENCWAKDQNKSEEEMLLVKDFKLNAQHY